MQPVLKLAIVGVVLGEGVEAGHAVVRIKPQSAQHSPLIAHDCLVRWRLCLEEFVSESLFRLCHVRSGHVMTCYIMSCVNVASFVLISM